MTTAHGRFSRACALRWCLIGGLGLGACDQGDETPAIELEAVPATSEVDERELGREGVRVVYVPAYSHVFAASKRRVMLSITLSVRNVDPTREVVLRYVDYYDTPGHRVRRYLERPLKLRPLGTAEYSVDVMDEAGGSGANFLLGWQAPEGTHPLLVEAIMLGDTGTGPIGFTSRGVPLGNVKRNLNPPEGRQ